MTARRSPSPAMSTTASSSGSPTRPPASPKPIPGARLNDVLADPINWMSDNRHILAVLVPESRGPAPAAPRAPIGPNVQESSGHLSQMATFQDMLTNPHDEDLFEHFATGQLARIDTETGQIERIGPAALITGADFSPDEKYLLVRRFAVRSLIECRTSTSRGRRRSGTRAAGPIATIADLPISDDVPRQGVPTGPRPSAGSRCTTPG